MDATLEIALAIVMNRYSISEWWSLNSKQRVALIYSEIRPALRFGAQSQPHTCTRTTRGRAAAR